MREPKLNLATSKRHLDKSIPYFVRSGCDMAPWKAAFLSAHFSAIAHATEDVANVERAVRFLVGLISKNEMPLSRQYLKGHHGNMITTISARLPAKELPSNALELLSKKLSGSDRQFLSGEIRSCVDEEGNLFLRFDKQEAFLGTVRLQQGDPIRIKLKFASTYDAEGIVEFCRENGLIP